MLRSGFSQTHNCSSPLLPWPSLDMGTREGSKAPRNSLHSTNQQWLHVEKMA